MLTFDIQRFDATYDVTDLATVGQIKTLATRVATRLAALESPKAFRGAKIEDNKLKFYEGTDTTVTPLTSIDLPEELYLQSAQTEIVEDFAFNSETYVGATNPNLDGKAVLVLAIKTVDKGVETTSYSFISVDKLVDIYTAGDNSININGYQINVRISAVANNAITLQSDGLHVDISGKQDKDTDAVTGNVAKFDANGKIKDSGHAIATDAQFEAMLTEAGLPAAS